MLAFSRQQPLAPQLVDVNELLYRMRPLITRSLAEEIEIEFHMATEIRPCLIDAGQLEQAMLNLSINARDAMPKGGRLKIETAVVSFASDDERPEEMPPGDYVMIEVSDNGEVIPRQDLERIFEPFFTTKDVGEGTGLGLSMVFGFIKQSEGFITVSSTEGSGTLFRIYLPAMESEAGVDEKPIGSDIAFGDSEVILVVDDEPSLLSMLSKILQANGYQVLLAGDGQEGLKQLSLHPHVDLLLTDIMLPGGMNGRQVADAAKRENAALKVLFMSGYPRDAIIEQGRLEPSARLLSKPFNPTTLVQAVREILDGE
ncbi:MAG: ATP-binding protein [Alphaproteobacteria bacterium]